MAAEFAGIQNDVEKFGAVEIVQVLVVVFHFVRGSRAIVNEAPHGLRVRNAQTRPFAHFVIAIQPLIADGDKMLAAKSFSIN